MMTPLVTEMKQRLRDFLANPRLEEEFRVWFALSLRNVHKADDPEAEALAHAVQQVFSDAGRGLYNSDALMAALSRLATPATVAHSSQEWTVYEEEVSVLSPNGSAYLYSLGRAGLESNPEMPYGLSLADDCPMSGSPEPLFSAAGS